jgi:hypothetical protein
MFVRAIWNMPPFFDTPTYVNLVYDVKTMSESANFHPCSVQLETSA